MRILSEKIPLEARSWREIQKESGERGRRRGKRYVPIPREGDGDDIGEGRFEELMTDSGCESSNYSEEEPFWQRMQRSPSSSCRGAWVRVRLLR
jgi:hypothetical protein